MASRPTVLCVLGMHRSGTSLATGILGQLGVYLGSKRSMMAPGPDNPKGFWELDPVRDLNDDILAAFGGTWDDPPAFPARWERGRVVASLRDRARELIRSEFGERERWAWKDPRTSLTLPLWRRVTPPMRYVVCVRNPVEVAASLERRNEIPVARGVALWHEYTAAAVRHSTREPRLLVSFEELLADRQGSAQRLAAFAGIEMDQEAARRVDAFVADELRHETADAGEALEGGAVPPRTRALYGALLASIDAHRGSAPDPALDEALEALTRV